MMLNCRQVTVSFKDKNRITQDIGLNHQSGCSMLEVRADSLLLTIDCLYVKDNQKKLLKSINFIITEIHEFVCEQVDWTGK